MEELNFFYSLVSSLLIVVNPFIVVSGFVGLSGEASQKQQRELAVRASLVSLGIGCAFGIFGMSVLEGAGITVSALRIAGGFLLFRTACELVSAQEDNSVCKESSDLLRLAVFPLAFPTIIGPGALCIIADALGTISKPHIGYTLGIVLAVAITVGVNFAFLYMAPQILKFLGKSILEIIKKLVGLFLAMLAVQIMIGGVSEVYKSWEKPETGTSISFESERELECA
ncbi:hypothetical protein HE1_01139 [Holospora elegans E1]|uniref:UPF0056 membrane protein n=1 Tax=Holospora elegans E1 TaxID=1427503 RepID=A0A023E132_9PROT|nr:MarC family protein [Holospora elegans]GAJ46797.1 hypothetical protein HE1_01139 [Holospora elegans E1]